MFSIKSTLIILGLTALVKGLPFLAVKISMTNFWLYKSLTITPQLNFGDSFHSLDKDTKSTWYIFGDYFNKVARKELPVIIATSTTVDGVVEIADQSLQIVEDNVVQSDQAINVKLECEEHETPRLVFQEIALSSKGVYCKFYLYCFSLGFRKEKPKMLNRKGLREPGRKRRGPMSFEENLDDEENVSQEKEPSEHLVLSDDAKIVHYYDSYMPSHPGVSRKQLSRLRSFIDEKKPSEIAKSGSQTIF